MIISTDPQSTDIIEWVMMSLYNRFTLIEPIHRYSINFRGCAIISVGTKKDKVIYLTNIITNFFAVYSPY